MTRSTLLTGALASACVPGPSVDPPATSAASSGESDATTDATTDAATGATTDPCGEQPSCSGASGRHLWSRRFPVHGSAWATGAAIDPSGNIVLHGTFGGGSLILGDITLTSTTDYTPWIAKFAPDGTPLWGRILGEYVPDMEGQGLVGTHDGNLVITDDGGVIMTGRCVDAIDFGDGPVLGAELDPFVVRLSADGDIAWGHRFSGIGDADFDPPGVFAAIGPDGDTWVAGTLFGSIDLGGETLVSAGHGDVLLIRFDAGGLPLWHAQLGNPGTQVVHGIAVDADRAPVVVGRLEGSLALGDVELASAGLGDVFVLKWTAAGGLAWARRFGENLDQTADSVAVVGDRIFISGTFERSLDLGGGPLYAGFNKWGWVAEPFLAAFDLEGAHQWSRRAVADDSGSLLGPILGAASPDALVGTGYLSAALEFGGTRLGDADGGFVAVYDAEDGDPRWLRGFANHVQWTGIQVVSTLRDARAVTAFVDGDLHDLGGGPLGQPGALSLYLAAYEP